MREAAKIEEIEEELQTFNVKCDDGCLQKLKEFCCLYRQEAEEIVEQWVAFSCSNSNCALTLDRLENFEKNFLVKELSKNASKNESSNGLNNSIIQSPDVQENGVIEAYLTPDAKRKKIQSTPDNVRRRAFNSSPANGFSPSSFSPNCSTPSHKYKSRSNSSEILSKFGDTENTTWRSGAADLNAPVEVSHFDADFLKQSYPFMFEKLRNKATITDDRIDTFGELIMKQNSIEHLHNVRGSQSDDVTVVGQICCDGNGKLNTSSVLLEGSVSTSGGSSVLLDVSNLSQYSFFPGQITGFEGINSTGRSFAAKRMIPPRPNPVETVESNRSVLQVVIACGPFSTRESLSYEPFYDLVKYVVEYAPEVCLLIGPFVDSRNEDIEKGKFNENPEGFFQAMIENMLKMTESISTKFILVPSYRDFHHTFIYPTPPFASEFLKNNPRVFVTSDPSMISINGVVFGVTSTDIVLHLGKEEIWFPPSSPDRLKRLVGHLIHQQSFYPLNPPAEEMNVDFENAEKFVNFPVTPHILVVPSDLKNFIKDVNGCCCVNPERITKGMLGGTFARMQINLPNKSNNSINVSAEVLRI